METELIDLTRLFQPVEWMQRANCRGLNPSMFFPERGDIRSAVQARLVCADCVVRAECLAYAVDNVEPRGIWGGTTREERQTLRHGVPHQITVVHGTDRGYHAHRKIGETPCITCRRAHADHKVEYEARRASA